MYPGCLLTIPLQCSLRFCVSSLFVNYTIAVFLEILCIPACLLTIPLQCSLRFSVPMVFVNYTSAVLLEILCIQGTPGCLLTIPLQCSLRFCVGCLLTIPLQCAILCRVRFCVPRVFVSYTIAVLLEFLCIQRVC